MTGQKITWDMLRYIRLCRNLSQEQFGQVCKIDRSVLAKIERNELILSPLYKVRIKDGIQTLNITEQEIEAVTVLLQLKNNNGGLNK
ncbi:helix-turn-helix transcriptional regulator [Bacillus sp. X1(2014)]|uniref:helix-turn-helix domain-containing protein n=1 Tax=Bacillus sp. X1(2014) TaxID=1565991 RepID=UPI0011A1B622|nr:helix-turn-helix transcriptional regulator [Bacillus sp. X1(2014)]